MRSVVARGFLAHGTALLASGAVYAGCIYIGKGPIFALAAATFVGAGLRFLLQKLWVFDDVAWKGAPTQAGKSFLLETIAFCANAAALYYAVDLAHWNPYVAQAIFAVILNGGNFLVSRRRIFGREIPVRAPS